MLTTILTQSLLIENILAPILYAVGTLLAGALTFGAAKFAQWVGKKTKNETLAKAIETIGGIVSIAVSTTNQQFLDQLKADKKFDKAAQKEAFNKTLEMTKQLLTEESIKIIEELFGDVETYLTGIIEDLVRTGN